MSYWLILWPPMHGRDASGRGGDWNHRFRALGLSFLPLCLLSLEVVFIQGPWLQVASGLPPYSLMIKEERGASCHFQLEKSQRETLICSVWVMCLSLDQWLWSREWDIMIGQSLSHSSSLWSGGEGTLREVCWTSKLPQLSLVFAFSRQRPCIISSLMAGCLWNRY